MQAALDAVSVARNDARELGEELRLAERDRWCRFRERYHWLVRVCAAAAVGQRCAKEHTCTLAPSFQYGQSGAMAQRMERRTGGGRYWPGEEPSFSITWWSSRQQPAAFPGHKNKV